MFTDVCPARTKAAMLLKMKLQRPAPITPNPMLYAYPISAVVYNVGLVVVVGWLRCVGQVRLLGRLASVRWVCVPAHVPDLQRWLIRVVVSFALVVWVLKVLEFVQQLFVYTVILTVCKQKVFVCTVILSTCKQIVCVCKQILSVGVLIL